MNRKVIVTRNLKNGKRCKLKHSICDITSGKIFTHTESQNFRGTVAWVYFYKINLCVN